MKSKLPKVIYKGVIEIGDVKLHVAVLDDERRVISETSVANAILKSRSGAAKRMKKEEESGGAHFPVFLASKSLQPFIPKELQGGAPLVEYLDGGRKEQSYDATVLPLACEVWLAAREAKALMQSQLDKAQNAEILMRSLAKVGIVALIDEATGYQYDRKYNALRVLLETYLADEIKPWTKKFPNQFFAELDRLYGNENRKPSQRPSYYGHFINTYVYKPLENGVIDAELSKRYKADNKRNRKHQYFTPFGGNRFEIQVGRIMGLLEISPSMRWFTEKQKRQGQLSLFYEFD